MKSNIISTTSDSISSGGTVTGDLTVEGDFVVEGGGSLTVDAAVTGDTTMTSATSTKPVFTIENTNADESGAQLLFLKTPSDSSEANDDV